MLCPSLLHPRRALREFQEYEEAVKRKGPARALRFLKSIEKDNGDPVEEKLKDVSLSIESPQPQLGELGFVGGLERDWEVLDTCLNASDMRLVGGPYGFLKDRGFLPNFGKFSSIAYLMDCPIRGVILDPIAAMEMGIQGQLSTFLQAGTQFWDKKMSNELAEGQLSGSAFDRYCMVLFAAIAPEAPVYGEAEGGENDENMFRQHLCPSATPIVRSSDVKSSKVVCSTVFQPA
ncbi:hypothetical protein SLEP1_g38285 [Rubroshorea leprosula]|uniref:Uncharacterized protein n=1 Tax=Rubroshorea leprosula TaxID=152421 RepID=A0AAV5KXI2_9ROSI|nr:hypothetical protein SLEP1_g38285 [Rubroshorea leprosula]